MNNAEEVEIRKEWNPQDLIFCAMNRCINTRQSEVSRITDGLSGVWLSLFPRERKRLNEKLGLEGEITNFGKVLDWVKEHNIREEIREDTDREKKIKACEYLWQKIQDVIAEAGLLYDKRRYMIGRDR